MLHRRSIRLKNYDYSSPGAYFITICTYNKQKFFGEIVDGRMELNEAGDFAQACWTSIPEHYPDVRLDKWVIMPDHIHGILWIGKKDFKKFPDVGVQNFEPLHQEIFTGIICTSTLFRIPLAALFGVLRLV
jgi:hypothetical protein